MKLHISKIMKKCKQTKSVLRRLRKIYSRMLYLSTCILEKQCIHFHQKISSTFVNRYRTCISTYEKCHSCRNDYNVHWLSVFHLLEMWKDCWNSFPSKSTDWSISAPSLRAQKWFHVDSASAHSEISWEWHPGDKIQFEHQFFFARSWIIDDLTSEWSVCAEEKKWWWQSVFREDVFLYVKDLTEVMLRTRSSSAWIILHIEWIVKQFTNANHLAKFFLLHPLSKRGTGWTIVSVSHKNQILWKKRRLFSDLFGDYAMDMWVIIKGFHNEDKALCEVASAKITSEVFFSSNGLQIIREAVQRVDVLAAESEH